MAEIEAAFAEGARLLLARDFSGAERACEHALGHNPDRAQGWYLLGRARQELGKLEEAAQAHRRAVELQPGFVEAHNNLGIVLKNLGRVDQALSSYREAVRLRPDYVEACNNLGNVLVQVDRLDEAIECFRHIIRSRPDYVEAHNNLGLAFKAQGRWAEAEASLREAIRLQPGFAVAFTNLGIVLAEMGENDQAMACYARALAIEPRLEEALCGRGCLIGRRGELEEAESSFREAIRLIPDSAELWGNHGYFLAEQGRISEGLASYREAMRLGPGSTTIQSNYLFFLNYDPRIDAATLLAEHRRGAAALTAGATPRSHEGHDRSGGRPLRVGYVSPDLRRHAVACFFEPILANHDRRRVRGDLLCRCRLAGCRDCPAALVVARMARDPAPLGRSGGGADPARSDRHPGRSGGAHGPQPAADLRSQARPGAGHLPGLPEHDRARDLRRDLDRRQSSIRRAGRLNPRRSLCGSRAVPTAMPRHPTRPRSAPLPMLARRSHVRLAAQAAETQPRRARSLGGPVAGHPFGTPAALPRHA